MQNALSAWRNEIESIILWSWKSNQTQLTEINLTRTRITSGLDLAKANKWKYEFNLF